MVETARKASRTRIKFSPDYQFIDSLAGIFGARNLLESSTETAIIVRIPPEQAKQMFSNHAGTYEDRADTSVIFEPIFDH